MFFKSLGKVFVFLFAYFKASYYNLIQNITGKNVYKWQKFTAEFKQKYEDVPQKNTLFIILSFLITILIFVLFLVYK